MPEIKKEDAVDESTVDYLHPDGKPATSEQVKTVEEYAIGEKSVQKSIDEADGHHMCSEECQKHHLV